MDLKSNHTKVLFKKPERRNIVSGLVILFLCFTGITNLSAEPSYVQMKKISLNLENVDLVQVFNAIKDQSEFSFWYRNNDINPNEKVSVKAQNETITEVLDKVLKDKDLSYEVSDKHIVITKNETTVKSSQQQGNKIQGKVLDSNRDPLIGVSVSIKGTSNGTVTNMDGEYSLNINQPNSILVFSYIGFYKQEINIGNQREINVTLLEDAKQLEEIVVVGYGTQKKVNLTGAVDVISNKELENRSMPNLSQGLQGVIPNLNLVMKDGKPIQSPEYNIRGNTSIGQQGSALVLIDGVEGDPSMINPNDIASVSVLKDASSAAIYGARGVFGVVLITTKNPDKNKVSVTYSANYASKSIARFPETMHDGYTYSKMFNEAWSAWNDYAQTPQNVNKTVKFSQAYLEEFERRSKDPNAATVDVNSSGEYVYYDSVDYFRELYKSSLGATEQNISVSGSGEKSGFYITGRYFGQDGLFRYNSDDYSIYNLRAKGYVQIAPWIRLENNMEYSNMKYHNPLNVGESGGIWRNIADEGHPMAPIFNPDGTLSWSAAFTVGDFWYGKNGIDMDKRIFRNTTGFVTEFFKNTFRVKGDFSIQNKDEGEKRIRVPVPYSRKPGVIEYVGQSTNDIREIVKGTEYLATNIYTEYENTFNKKHYIKGMVGYNYEQSTYEKLQAQRNGLINPDATDISLALGQSISTEGGWDKWAIMGGFFRANYIFDNKYLVEVNGRYDGSSKFPTNQRYAFFPSVSLGWRVAQEGFWKIDPKIFTDLKIRASYGSLGNGNVASYAYQEQFKIYQSPFILNGVKPQQTSQPGVLPNGLTWETATTQDVGLDMSFLSNRLTFSGDMYTRTTTDMYTKGPTLPAVFGTDVPKGNYADMQTKGWELVLGWRDQFNVASKPFTYDVRFTLADYQAEITKFNNDEMILNDYYAGQKLGEIWGYQVEGFFTADNIAGAPTQNLTKASNSGKILPGDIKFRDLDDSKTIDQGNNRLGDSGDKRIIGNSTPRYTYGINLGGNWNNFFFSVFFQGVGKQDWWPGGEADMFWGQYNRPYNKIPMSHIGNIWSEDNPNAYFPRYRGYVAQNGSGELRTASDKYLQNVAYIRLKNLQIGYDLPQKLISKVKMTNARVYLSGENLWSYSPLYKIINEMDVESIGESDKVVTESNSGNGNNYPILKSFSLGMSITF